MIVIFVFNEIKYIIECLSFVNKYIGEIDYEIIIMDDCFEDEIELILKEVENIIYLSNFENLGFLFFCNKVV